MNSIFATLLTTCLAVAGVSVGASAQAQAQAQAQPQQSPAKKEQAPTLKQEPAGVVCAKSDKARHTDSHTDRKHDRKPATGMPSKEGGSACPETWFAPMKPMA